MKKNILFILLSISFIKVYSQNTDFYKVIYQYNGVTNLTQPDKRTNVQWNLFISSKGTAFFDPNRRFSDSLYALDYKSGLEPIKMLAQSSRYRQGIPLQCYISFSTNKMTVFDNLGVYYKYEEKLPLQEWELQQDTLRIMGLLTYKATCKFRGRTYIAFYTPDIPIAAGPWKFSGLPGLILKIYDDQKHHVFEFLGFQKIDSEMPVPLVPDARQSNFIEFARLKRLRFENPSAFLSVMTPGINITPANESSKKAMEKSKNSISGYNPIELEDK